MLQHSFQCVLSTRYIWHCPRLFPSVKTSATHVPFVIVPGCSLLEKLQPHMFHLQSMIPFLVQDMLQERGILCIGDIDCINLEKTPCDRNTKLLELLVQRKASTQEVVSAICEGLCQSAQYCPFNPSENQPLSADLKQALERNRRMLIENLEVLPVLDHMHQAGIINRHFREEVESERTRRKRVHHLLSIVSHLHTKAYLKFMEAIEDTQPLLYQDLPETRLAPWSACCYRVRKCVGIFSAHAPLDSAFIIRSCISRTAQDRSAWRKLWRPSASSGMNG